MGYWIYYLLSVFFKRCKQAGAKIRSHKCGSHRGISFCQNVALAMVNKFVKFDENNLHLVKVMTRATDKV